MYEIVLVLVLLMVLLLITALRCHHSSRVITGGVSHFKNLSKHPRTKSEARAIGMLERITGKKFPTVNPSWLVWKGARLELDGYNKGLGIAIEFSGPLHTKWFPNVEPYEKYFGRLQRDLVKKCLCKKMGICLIVIDMCLPTAHWTNYIKSRLHDFGLRDKPDAYIEEQTAVPYRNPHLEAELGLVEAHIC